MTTGETPFTLDQYAATSCPVRTQNTFNPLIGDPEPIDAGFVERFRETTSHRDQVLRALFGHQSDSVRDLRGIRGDGGAAAIEAMAHGYRIIIGAELPADAANHRRGTADVLLRGDDAPGGRHVYHPVLIKDHAILAATPKGQGGQLVAPLVRPFLHQARAGALRFRIESHGADLLQLVHLWYLLQAAGFAAEPPWGGVIGTDHEKKVPGQVVVWMNLDARQIRVFSYASTHQWKRYSAHSRYRHEHRFRVRVASRALQQTGSPDDPELVAAPVRVPECEMCEWWSTCRSSLADDISLRIERSPLDAREIMTLRNLGLTTITDLAASDIDSLLPDYLPLVAHRNGAEARLRLAAHRGRLLAAGTHLERLTSGPIDLPQAPVEIDFDIETSAENRVYLWGFLVHDRRDPSNQPEYHPVARFATLTSADEVDLAEQAATWLRDLVTSFDEVPVLVWHYSTYEITALRRFGRVGQCRTTPNVAWLTAWARTNFVDLLPVVKQHFFGVDGLGLKAVATVGAGFSWRDPDPHGLNSQFWFADATHMATASGREAAQRRILEYNEDDVRATWTLRRWLRSLT